MAAAQKRELEEKVAELEAELAQLREERSAVVVQAEATRVQLEARASEAEEAKRDLSVEVMVGKKEREGLAAEVERLAQEVAEGRLRVKAVSEELKAASDRAPVSPTGSPGRSALMTESTAQLERLQAQLHAEVERRVMAEGKARQLEAEVGVLRSKGDGRSVEAAEVAALKEELAVAQSRASSSVAQKEAAERELLRLRAAMEHEAGVGQGGEYGQGAQERNVRVRALLKENAECHAQVRQLSAEVVGLTEALEMVTKKAQDKDVRHLELQVKGSWPSCVAGGMRARATAREGAGERARALTRARMEQAKMERIIRLAGLVDPLLALDAQRGPALKRKKKKALTAFRGSLSPPRTRAEGWGHPRPEEPPLPGLRALPSAATPVARRLTASAIRPRPQSARARIEQLEERQGGMRGGGPGAAWEEANMPPIESAGRREYFPEAPRHPPAPPPGGLRRPFSANATSESSLNHPRPPASSSGQPSWKPPGTTDGVFAGGGLGVAGSPAVGARGQPGGLMLEGTLRPFSFLVQSVQEGLVTAATPVVVLIEFCNSEHYSRRHDIARYQQLFERVCAALAEQLRGRRMTVLANRSGDAGGQEVVEPRAGAFEVFVEWTGTDGATHTVVLFSKLESMSYPNPLKVAARLRNVLNGGEDGAEGGYGDSAEFIS